MYRRDFLKLMATAAGSTLMGSGCCAQRPTDTKSKTPPNVLLICIDDLKPVLGCYGDPMAKTPNIDRLATRGMCFDLAYCNQAVCAPSRNTLMTGSRSTSLGVYSLGTFFRKAAPDAITMSQYFMRYGWRAEAVGKIYHIGHGNQNDAASWTVPHDPIVGSNYIHHERARGPAWENADVADNAYRDGRIADEGVRRLVAAAERSDEPFFLAIGFNKPHLPFAAPKKYWDMYDPKEISLASRQIPPEGAPSIAGRNIGEIGSYQDIPDLGLFEDDLQRTLIHGYYASVSYVDAQVGRVLDTLDRLKMADNTLIVLWGDHGFHLGDLSYWTKHTNYEQANRIPLIFAAPGVVNGNLRTHQLAETVDIYPTLTELAGLPHPDVPQPIDGISLVPVLRDPSVRLRDHAYHAYPRGKIIGRAIRTERYRLVEWKVPGAPVDTAVYELYDYHTDPLETRNLFSEYPEIANNLRAILARHPEARIAVS